MDEFSHRLNLSYPYGKTPNLEANRGVSDKSADVQTTRESLEALNQRISIGNVARPLITRASAAIFVFTTAVYSHTWMALGGALRDLFFCEEYLQVFDDQDALVNYLVSKPRLHHYAMILGGQVLESFHLHSSSCELAKGRVLDLMSDSAAWPIALVTASAVFLAFSMLVQYRIFRWEHQADKLTSTVEALQEKHDQRLEEQAKVQETHRQGWQLVDSVAGQLRTLGEHDLDVFKQLFLREFGVLPNAALRWNPKSFDKITNTLAMMICLRRAPEASFKAIWLGEKWKCEAKKDLHNFLEWFPSSSDSSRQGSVSRYRETVLSYLAAENLFPKSHALAAQYQQSDPRQDCQRDWCSLETRLDEHDQVQSLLEGARTGVVQQIEDDQNERIV